MMIALIIINSITLVLAAYIAIETHRNAKRYSEILKLNEESLEHAAAVIRANQTITSLLRSLINKTND